MRIRPYDLLSRLVLAGLMAISIVLMAPKAAQAQGAGHWEPRASLPEPVNEPRGAVVGSKIYVMGGLDDAGSVPLGLVFVYDTATDSWDKRKKMPVPGHHLMMTEYKGKIYMFGGYDRDNSLDFFHWRVLDNSWEYTPETDSWKALAPLPGGGRGAGEAVLVDGKIYVIGGGAPVPGETDPVLYPDRPHAVVGRVEVYDVEAGTWETKATMTTARNHFHASAVGGKIYVMGGRLGSTYVRNLTNTDIVQEYDVANDSWATRKRMPTARSGVAGTSYKGKVYVAGGEYQNEKIVAAFRAFEVYDPAKNSWSDAPSMPIPRHGPTGLLVGNHFYVIGGAFQSSGIGRVTAFTDTQDVFIFDE